MARLDKERQRRLEPARMIKAIAEIKKLGYNAIQVSETRLQFITNPIQGYTVSYFPYSGWATGREIKDGRGLRKLLNQLKTKL